MTNSNEEDSSNRLEQIESILLRLTQYQESTRRQQNEEITKLMQLIQSNNKFLEGFSVSLAEIRTSIKELSGNVDRLTDEVRFTQRQMREILHRVDTNSTNIRDLTADIRELYQENQRILRHLEGR